MLLNPSDPNWGHFSPPPRELVGQYHVQYLKRFFFFSSPSNWYPSQWAKRQPGGMSKGKLGLFPILTVVEFNVSFPGD